MNTVNENPYVLTGTEIVEFSGKWDPFEFHTDAEQADQSFFEGLAASGVHTICISNRLGHDILPWHVIAAVGVESKWPNPAYSGDELTLNRTVTDKRESKSRPDMGVVTHHSRLINQKGLVVLESKIVLLVAKKP